MARATGTRRAILDAALELAAVKGISGTTMDDVAEQAGVAKGSLYYNFTSKDLLFEALLQDGVGALTETLREARNGKHGAEAVEALIRTLLARIALNGPLAKLMAAEIFRTDRSWQKTLFGLRQDALTVFSEAITEADPEAQHGGMIDIMAGSVFGAVLMAGLEWRVFEPERDEADVAAAIIASLSSRWSS